MIKCLAILVALIGLTLAHEPFIVQFQWNYVNYTWPSEEAYERAEKDEVYLKKNNVISGVKFWKDKMYLTIPRWRSGVPVTLAVTRAAPIAGQTAPKLEPFPSWDMQKIGNCDAFQFVQNIEIDPKGRMWVLDTGRDATLTLDSKGSCPPRLVILDLENKGAVLRSYPFPSTVANPDSAYLNDLVLDHEDGGYAYITDSDETEPGLIVFNLSNNTSWRITHDSMRAKADAIGFIIEQIRVSKAININGIALSPASSVNGAERTLFYTPLSSFYVFAVPTRVLKYSPDDFAKEMRVLGRKPSQTDGMAMSNTGMLYFGLLADDAVALWDSRIPSFVTGQRIISRDHHLMQWPDSFAFDEAGRIWCVTNRLQTFLDNQLNVDQPNFRVIMAKINMRNYQYYENGTVPELPIVTAGVNSFAGQRDLALASLLALLVVLVVR